MALDASGAIGTFDIQGRRHGQDRDRHRPGADGTDAGNYIVAAPTTTADITAATLTVTGITASNKVYDGTTDATLDTSAASRSGLVDG